MWESPIYKLNQPLGPDQNDNQVYREIVIDVTKSAPPFSGPGKTLSAALLRAFTEVKLKKIDKILDFGAGKLRNALHLLEQGYSICGVEYESLFVRSEPAASALQRATRFTKRFSTLVYPHQFAACQEQFDLALLINVINVMPIPAERLLVLQYCNQKLRPGGHLFWYTQRGDADYSKRLTPDYRVGDGYYVGLTNKYKTFYREFTVAEIDTLLANAGFDFVCPISATSRNQARLYRKTGEPPLLTVLHARDIKSASVVDEKIPVPMKVAPREVISRPKKKGNPDPDKLKVEKLLIVKLGKITLGKSSATPYQRHVKDMLEILFPKELRNLRLEKDVFGGLKRLDIIASNKSKSGFFSSLAEHHKIICPTIVIECKNYRHELKNPEFDQLGSRLGKKLGRFGILAYRRAANAKKVIARCRAFFDNDEKVILPLNDADFEKLLTLKMQLQDEDIENYLDEILLEVKAG